MKWFKKFFRFYIDSNIHVSIASASLVWISVMNFRADSLELNTVLFVFFSTLFSYIFIRIFEKYSKYQSFEISIKQQKSYIPKLLLLSFVGVIFFAIKIPVTQLLILIPAGVLTVGYVFPIVKYKGTWISFRDYPGLKLWSIAFSWAIVTVLFPLWKYWTEMDVWIIFTQRFFLILVLAIPFDIRDLHVDDEELNTLPQSIGVRKTITSGFVFLIIFLFLSIFLSLNVVSDIFVFVVSLLFLLFTKEKQSTYFASFWIENIPIFWLLFILFQNYISSHLFR